MTYIKLLTVLAGLALLTACGGAAAPADKTGGDTKTSGDTNTGGNNNGGGGGNPTDCTQTPFHNDCLTDTPAIALRESMCLANIQIDDSCRGEDGIATVFCKDDPFNTATACVADTYLPDRVEDCITDGNAGIARCNTLFTASASNTCLTNPFTDACASNTDFGTYANTARVNRVSFCASDNTNSSLCTALTACQANPFGAGCGAYFADTRISHCMTNDVVACPNVTTADWLASFTANGGTALPTTPNTTPTNEFLAITATTASSLTDVVPTTLFMTGSTTNGIAFFRENNAYYAGILAGANLGAPITETITAEANVKWTGQFRALSTSGNGTLDGTSNNTFELDITFDGAEGTMTTIFANAQFAYQIAGEFDANGIITGKVNYGAGNAADFNPAAHSNLYSPGTLTGIIGQNGAVGAFHSDNANPEAGANASRFAGGFIALPPALDGQVNTADWVAGFTPAPITAGDYTRQETHEFLQGTEVGVDFGTIRHGSSSLFPELRTLNFTSLEGEAKNGVAWFETFAGVNGISTPRRYYSGIFSGTSLGAPLTSADASVTVPWAGKIGWEYLSADGSSSNRSRPEGEDFDLTVDFANNEIRAFVNRTGTNHFLLKATFDGTGRFEGTMNHATFAGGLEAGAQTNVTTGVITGIIGKLGAVGAFYGGADDTDSSQGDYAGGFVASPPSE